MSITYICTVMHDILSLIDAVYIILEVHLISDLQEHLALVDHMQFLVFLHNVIDERYK